MEKHEMHRILEELHSELEATDQVDANAQSLLREVMTEIADLLERSGGGSVEHRRSLVERLRGASRHFEDSHPSLVAAVGRLMDALSKIGV